MGEFIRLDKYLADMSVDTRSRIKALIGKGRVQVNGVVEKNPARKIDKYRDRVLADGDRIVYTAFEYIMLNKPSGVVSASTDSREKTVLDLIEDKVRKDLFPVGRLDKDTEGLLLITNDGELSHRLLSPKKHVDKVYYAETDKRLFEEDKRLFEEGIDIGDDKPAMPARIEEAGENGKNAYLVTVREGRFHQIKRMFQAVGAEVTYLRRIKIGSLSLDETLTPGQYRRLTEEELKLLKGAGPEKKDVSGKIIPIEMFDAVIFDLDGTLVDSMWIWHDIDVEYLGSFQIAIPEDLQRSIEGKSFSETAVYFKERFSLPVSVEEIKESWNRMSREIYENRVMLKPGAMEFMERLKRMGIKMGIATSNSPELTDCVLKARGIADYFGAVVTGCDVQAGKPKPDVYLRAAGLLGASPEKCLVFEDIPKGILAGKNAGMTTCAVEDAYSCEFSEEKRKLADYYIDSYYDVL